MKDTRTTNEQAETGEQEQAARLPYESPALISYNASANTRGGINTGTGDSIGSITNYKAPS